MWLRLKALIIKELLAVLRDPRSRFVLIMPPLMQLLIFTYAATLEVRNVDLMVLNRDGGYWSGELVRRLEGAPTFRSIRFTRDPQEMREAIDEQQVIAAIGIDADFSRTIAAGRPASVQLILDGRRSNAAQIVGNYISQVVSTLGGETPAGERAAALTPALVERNWFNPNLEYQWFIVPSLIAEIGMLISLILTALAVARERELGTFDQLMVSPLRAHEILLGKLIPPLLLGLAQMTFFVVAAVFFFKVPLRGALLPLYGSGLFFLASVVGLGLFISSLCKTQQQAILGAFLLLVPATTLSGFATPIDNMPDWLQPFTYLNPLRYFLVVVKGIFLRDLPLSQIALQTAPLALIALVTLTAAAWLFRRRME